MAVVILIQLEETGVVVDISCGVLQHRALEWNGMGYSRVLKAEKQRQRKYRKEEMNRAPGMASTALSNTRGSFSRI